MNLESSTKAKGELHAIDKLGRVVIPRALQRRMGYEAGDVMEISVGDDGQSIRIAKYFPEDDYGTLIKAMETMAENLLYMGRLDIDEAKDLREHLKQMKQITANSTRYQKDL